MELLCGKTWADWKYIQKVILSFLAKSSNIQNKQSVFFALFFNNLFDECHNRNKTSQVNVEALFEFLQATGDSKLISRYKASMFLMTNIEFTYNDLISESDFNWFKDLLTYNQPFEVRQGIFGLIQDESNFSFKFKRTKLKTEELKQLIPECIQSMIHNLPVIANRDLRYAYADTLNLLLRESINFRVK